ncbi:MAG: hypothetical protein EP329_20890 [Deltaproteobacteria bacterium]|nr:MAG: hypothetical protein EP329_20890 [Deltaproteobacteria bacterium]
MSVSHPAGLSALAAALLVALLSLVPNAHAAAPPPTGGPCDGVVVAKATLTGCERTACPTAGDRARFLRLAELVPGATLTDASVARAKARLLETSFFRAVAIGCHAGADGGEVEVIAAPHTVVRRVRITGNQFFKRRDLLKRVFLRSGTVLDLDPAAPGDNPQIQRQITSLLRLYAGAGLDDVTITPNVEEVSEATIDLELTIREGTRAHIETIQIAHHHTGAPDPEGLACPTISQRRLERLAGVEYGDVHTSNLQRQVRDRLRRAFQAVGFVRPRFDSRQHDDGDTPAAEVDADSALRETVTTDRCWVIRIWQRESPYGDNASLPSFRMSDPTDPIAAHPLENAPFQRVPLSEWTEVLPFGESGVFDREEAARGVEAIAGVLRSRGYPFAEVAMEHRDLALRPERRGVDSEVRGVIDYTITLNHQRRIQGIRLVGGSSFPDEDLLALFETKVYDFFGASGLLDVDRFFADLSLLSRHYQDRGFYGFRFGLTGTPADEAPTRTLEVAGAEWIVWRYAFRDRGFLLKKRRGELGIYLEVPFEEGPRTEIVHFVATGNDHLATDAIAALTKLGPGDPFGKLYLEQGVARLQEWYRARGYHQVRIAPFCEAYASESGDESFCDPRSLVRADRVDLGLRVTEGPQVDVGEIFVRGNFKTDTHALTRDLPQSGEPLDQARLDEAMRKMRALGLFNSVRIDSIGLDEDPPSDDVGLVVSVEETGYRFLDFALGVRSIQRQNLDRVPSWAASGAGNLVSNIDRATTGFGRAFPLDIPDVLFQLEAEYLDLNLRGLGHRLQIPLRFGVSFSDPLRLLSLTPTYTWPRLADTSLQLETRLIAELDRVTDPLDRIEFGLENDLSVPITKRMVSGLTLKGGVLKIDQPSDLDTLVDLSEGLQPQFQVRLRWRWDERDNPLHPTRGFELTASTSLIWDRDRRTGEFNQFLKWEASAQVVVDLNGPVAALFARYGGSRTFGEPFLPANERYTLGGSNGLRGFGDNAVCRYDEDGKLDPSCPEEFGGNVVVNGSLELRLPLLRRLGFWVATFLDVGALADAHDTLYTSSFRFSWGVGARWLIGGQLPVRLDVGFPLGAARCIAYDSEGGPCTREDPSSVHFDFLYPF